MKYEYWNFRKNFFKCYKKNIEEIWEILSEIIFKDKNKFYGLEKYLRDEIPFIFTDNFLGFYLGLTQNPEDLNSFCLEIIDIDFQTSGVEIDLSDRLKFYISKCSDFIIGWCFKQRQCVRWVVFQIWVIFKMCC